MGNTPRHKYKPHVKQSDKKPLWAEIFRIKIEYELSRALKVAKGLKQGCFICPYENVYIYEIERKML